MVTTVLLQMTAATTADKFKKELQEHFRGRPTQLHVSTELTRAQMKPDKTIIEFNDRYTVLLEESTEEIQETCESEIIIVAYIDALQDDIGRKLRSNTTKFDKPHHLKAIKTLRDAMNQVVNLECEQKCANLQDADIMNISPESLPQNSESESDGVEIDTIYVNRRHKSRQYRNWDNNRKCNFDNKWQNRGRYSTYKNKDGYHKLRLGN